MTAQIDHMINALEHIAPEFRWAHIGTGGGCTAIYGELKNSPKNYGRSILITDGQACAPQDFADDATAIYYENEEQVEYRASKEWTDIQPFFELLTELARDVKEWKNETAPIEQVANRLNELATKLDTDDVVLHANQREQLIDDLKTAVRLLKTHANTEG